MHCPAWLVHEAQDGSAAPDSFLHLLQSEGLLPESQNELLADRETHDINAEELEDGALQTLELMKKGVERIRGGVLIDGRFVARPDLLEKVEGRSQFGNWYYVALDFKRSSRVKEQYEMEAVFYAEVLQKVQGTRPVQGYIAHANGEVSSILIDDFIGEYHEMIHKIDQALETGEEVFLSSSCKQSPWLHKCKEAAQECRDLSLINRIWRSEVHALQDAGFKTIDDLAKAKNGDWSSVAGIAQDRFEFLRMQAKSLVSGEVIALGAVDLQKERNAYVIDIEADPLRDIVYLFGVLKIEGDQETYHTFLADAEKSEEDIWHEVNTFLSENEWPIYHYGWYEVDVFRKLLAKYGGPMSAMTLFEQRGVDVIQKLRNTILFPSPFYSLKDVANYVGFEWRTEGASGLESIRWYHEWQENGDQSMKEKIIEYNEDDVRATWLVKEWAAEEFNNYGEQ